MGLFTPYWKKHYSDVSAIAPKLKKESEDKLVKIAVYAPSSCVQIEAIKRIGKEESLKQIVEKVSYDKVRNEALKRISDQAFLQKMILSVRDDYFYLRSDDYDPFCEATLYRLTSDEDIAKIALVAENDSLRDEADRLLSGKMDETSWKDLYIRTLNKIETGFWFPFFKLRVFDKDREVLAKVILADKDPGTRVKAYCLTRENGYQMDAAVTAASEKLMEDLKKIIQYDKDQKKRIDVIRQVSECEELLEDPGMAELIAKLAKEESDAKVRWEAVCCTKDQEALSYAALHDKEWPIRQSAVATLVKTDPMTPLVKETLKEVALHDSDDKIREMAAERIGKASLMRKSRKAHVHDFESFILYEKNERGQLEPLSRFKVCQTCGQYFCCDDLYKEKPLCDFSWSRRHIDSFPDAERVCFTCDETGDSLYGYVMHSGAASNGYETNYGSAPSAQIRGRL